MADVKKPGSAGAPHRGNKRKGTGNPGQKWTGFPFFHIRVSRGRGSPWGKEAWPMAIDAYGLRDEVERRVRNGETFSLQEIRRIMKQTGLSYVQVVSRAKALKKQMDQAEQEAEANGTVFDKEQYLHERMGGK